MAKGGRDRLRRADVARPVVAWSVEAAALVQVTRIRKGLSQHTVGLLVNLCEKSIDLIERGSRAPSPETLDKLCDLLGLIWFQPTAIVAVIGHPSHGNAQVTQVSREWATDGTPKRRQAQLSRQSTANQATDIQPIPPNAPSQASQNIGQ